jgi:hypothetical protein
MSCASGTAGVLARPAALARGAIEHCPERRAQSKEERARTPAVPVGRSQ